MACLRSCISPIRTSLSSSIRNPVSGKLGPLKSWLKNFECISPIYTPKFELVSIMQRRIVQNLNLSEIVAHLPVLIEARINIRENKLGPFNKMVKFYTVNCLLGRKMLAGSFLGLSVVAGVMYNQPIVTYAMDDHYVDDEGPSGFLKDDLHTLWSLTRKFELPIVLLVTVVLGWRHPITLAINIALLLLCTKPNPLTIYMFIEQLRRRDMRQDPSLFKSKIIYVKNVKVEDYKILCLAKVELRDVELDVIGILGGWWVFQTSRV